MLNEARDDTLWRLVQQSVPIAPSRRYFNTGGLGPMLYPVLEAIEEKMRELNSVSETGHQLHETVREKVAGFVGADPLEIAFTRNATEGMNFIARGIDLQPGDEILMTTHEHPGGAVPWLAVARDRKLRVRLFEPENDPQAMIRVVEKNLSPRTRVLMFSHVTCTLGTVFPAQELCTLARRHGVISVIDGAQAVGQIPVDLHHIGCDYYTTSGHKWLLGPRETGFVYISRAVRPRFRPSFVGAYSDNGYDLDRLHLVYREDAIVNEYGTRDAAKLWGLAAAVDFQLAIGTQRILQRLHQLSDRLKQGLRSLSGIELLTPETHGNSAGIVTFRVKHLDYLQVAQRLIRQYHMRVRSVGEHGINATRVSLHIFNDEQDVDALLSALNEISKG